MSSGELAILNKLDEIKRVLERNQEYTWKLLMLTIGGAFALIGIKLVLP